jgi:hypothetical protein
LVSFAVPITNILCVTNAAGMKKTAKNTDEASIFHSARHNMGGWISVASKAKLANCFYI